MPCTVWHEIFAGVYFCGLAIFCVLRELIFAIRTDWFFLLGINFCDFQTVPSTQFWEYFRFYWVRACNRNTVNIFSNDKINQYFVCFWMKETSCDWTDTISYFLCSEFKLENIYSEVNFFGKNVCGNFYLRELIFADRWQNRKNHKNVAFLTVV